MRNYKNRMYFVVSCGRSGTKSIAKQFGLEHEGPDGHKIDLDDLEKRVQKYEGNWWGKVSEHLIHVLPELKERFPGALFVHNVRNGRDVVRSFISLKRNPKGFEEACRHWVMINLKAERYCDLMVRFEDYQHMLPRRNYSDEMSANMGKRALPWTEEEETTFTEICGELMIKYGYEKTS